MVLAGLLLVFQGAASAAEPPRARGWDEFPVFVWREKYAGKPLPEGLVEPFGGVIVMREEDSGWARERGLSYLVWNVAGRDALHLDADEAWQARVERWIETRDEALLVREPCLSDPATVERLFATLEATLAKHGEHPGLGFVLGDEVSLTPNGDPFDLCRCEHCEARWKEHAGKNGLPERAPLTDELRLALLEDDCSLLGPWLARRRFDEEGLRHLLLRVRERGLGQPDPGDLRRYSPTAWGPLRFGLLGCSGVRAFGGLDLAPCGYLFDFVECYPLAEARETLLSSAHVALLHGTHGGTIRRSLDTLATVFVAEETPDGAAWRAWEHWLRGGSGLVIWSDEELEARPEHRARLAEAVNSIRALQEAGVQTPRDQYGGALAFDPDSIAASFLRDALLDGPTWPRRRSSHQAEHGTRERKVRSWLRWIEDSGELPGAIPIRSLRADCAPWYGFLVLPEILVLDPEDVVHLEEFVAAGGTLYVDGELGWVDRRGRPWEEDVFERLRRKAPARVLRPPPELASYLDTRLGAERAPVLSAPQSRVLELLAARGNRGTGHDGVLPDLGPDARRFPWLVARAWRSRPDAESGEAVFVQLPNLTTPEERLGLRDLVLETPAEDVTWLHPAAGEPLRAGDAAVFVPKNLRSVPPR